MRNIPSDCEKNIFCSPMQKQNNLTEQTPNIIKNRKIKQVKQ